MSLLFENLGLAVFTGLTILLAAYLLYTMVRPERF